MAGSFVNSICKQILDNIFRNAAEPALVHDTSSLYLALFTADPTETPASGSASVTNEVVSGTGYTRQLCEMDAATTASPSVTQNTNAETFGPAGAGGWGTVSHWCFYDNAATPIPVFHGSWDVSKTVLENDSLTCAAGNLSITLT